MGNNKIYNEVYNNKQRERKEEEEWKEAKTPLEPIIGLKAVICEDCKPLQPLREPTIEEKINMYLEAENWDKLNEVFNDPTIDWFKVNIKPITNLKYKTVMQIIENGAEPSRT